MATRGPEHGQRDLKQGLPLCFWHSCQLSLNKFFDLSTPSLRNMEPTAISKMADRIWKMAFPKVIGHSEQLSQNRFFDLRTPSMRY